MAYTVDPFKIDSPTISQAGYARSPDPPAEARSAVNPKWLDSKGKHYDKDLTSFWLQTPLKVQLLHEHNTSPHALVIALKLSHASSSILTATH